MSAIFGPMRKGIVEQVFREALCGKYITRAQIADKTGISLMTVGKVVDILQNEGLLIQAVFPSKSPGPRSRSVTCSKKYWSSIIYISELYYSFYFFDLSLKVLAKFEIDRSDDLFVDDELSDFASKIKDYISANHKGAHSFGYGILLSDEYDIENDRILSDSNLRYIKPMSLFEKYSLNTVPYVVNGYEVFKNSFALKKGKDYSGLLLIIDKLNLKCSYISNGAASKVVSLGKSFPLGHSDFHPKDFNSMLKDKTKIGDFSEKLAEYLIPVITTVPVDEITIIGDLFINMDAVTSLLCQNITEKCKNYGITPPAFCNEDHKLTAAKGIAEKLRDEWFFNNFFNDR